jgi:protein transport protein YIF1
LIDRVRLQGFAPFPGGSDAFMTGFATDMLHQQGASYLQRGQAFMQQRMGFMSTDVMHYFFNLNTEYGAPSCGAFHTRGTGRSHVLDIDIFMKNIGCQSAVRAKLLMLVAPFLRRWNYTRVLEQVGLQ